MQGIDIVDVQVTEPIVRTEIGGGPIVRAMSQHHAHAVALDKPPIRGLRPADAEAQHIPEIARTLFEVRDGEHECPGGDLCCHVVTSPGPMVALASANPPYRISATRSGGRHR